MDTVDLHVHSCHSKHPSEWFLKRIGAQESYSTVESVYRTAKERGMTYVTITDHNTIDGAKELHAAHPDDTFISTEATAYFPENGCKVHILCFDLNNEHFARIDTLRTDIYKLRDYLCDENIAHSVAHAAYSVNDRLDCDTFEKLIVLFNVFEGLNGARNSFYAKLLRDYFSSLTEERLAELSRKHGIAPRGMRPWEKGITGGSDDHAGIFVARTYTSSLGTKNARDFLRCVMNRETAAEGHGNDFKSFAFSIYKIAYDYTKSSPKAGSRAKDLLSMFNSLVFERGAMPLRERFMLNRLKNTASEKDRILFEFISRISADLTEDKNIPFEKKFDRIYENIAALVDNFFVLIAHSLSAHAKNNEPAEMFKNMFSAIPVFFLSAPFFSSMKQLSKERAILMRLLLSENGKQKYTRSKTLWFTDTIHDLNGVSVSLRRLIKTAHEHNREVALAVCTGNALAAELPEQTLDFPCIFEHTPDFYASYTLRFPSLLRALDAIDRFHPDRIVVSTPGPVGWTGILAARLLGIPCVCVYHTDFALQSQLITGDESLTDSVRMYTRFFYSFADEIRVPSRAYFSKLADDGYAAHKLKLFARGIDDSFVATPVNEKAAFTIVWAGRISHDKNIAFLLDLFREIRTRDRRTKLLIAGDGPALSHFAHEAESIGGVAFLGRIPADDLPTFYRSGDLMLFPSIMDTFGMSVLEAQACGIPCIVTDKGGPCEIVENGITGHVLPLADKQAWLHAAETYALERNCDIENYNKNKLYISERIRARFGWEAALRDILDNPVNTDERTSL